MAIEKIKILGAKNYQKASDIIYGCSLTTMWQSAKKKFQCFDNRKYCSPKNYFNLTQGTLKLKTFILVLLPT